VHSALRGRALKHRRVSEMDDLPSPSESAFEEAGLSWLLATDAGGFPWGRGNTLVTSSHKKPPLEEKMYIFKMF
jgi:hypothetical protein